MLIAGTNNRGVLSPGGRGGWTNKRSRGKSVVAPCDVTIKPPRGYNKEVIINKVGLELEPTWFALLEIQVSLFEILLVT